MSERRRYALVLLASYVVWVVAFYGVGTYASSLPTHDLTTPLDRAIPLVPGFVWAYELCYVLPLFSIVVLRDFRRFDVALRALAIANAVAFVVYVTCPVAFPRPVLGESLSERVLALEYAADFSPGANNLPSMHVAMSWVMGRAMLGQRGRAVDAAIVAAVGAITVSTLFVKQHLLLDVVAGAGLGIASWRLGLVRRARVGHNRRPAHGAPRRPPAQETADARS